ncbi:hypothetical protein TcWFU_010524 [Taenia crassiceps]|uniref:Exonuclease domain-containing protein n=1 Tax=Taenia crassiceps TaxID=6207 RepID=A0ABR4QUE6_9CEST
MSQLPPNKFSTIVFLDTETTGLPVAVNRSEMDNGCTPRVLNKLVVCFNPTSKILSEASVISVSISNDTPGMEEEAVKDGPLLNNLMPMKSRKASSLAFVYESVFGSVHDAAHTAEGDCIAVMKLVQFIGDCALSWIDNNYRVLSNIRKMYICDEADGLPLPSGEFPYKVKTWTACFGFGDLLEWYHDTMSSQIVRPTYSRLEHLLCPEPLKRLAG